MGAQCAFEPDRGEEEMAVPLAAAAESEAQFGVPADYDYTRSTEDNFGVEHFTGVHKDIRPLLDYTYHKKYSVARVAMQDRIVRRICEARPRPHAEQMPWVVFTAGAMGAGKGFVTKWMHERGFWDLDFFVKVDPDEIRHELPEWEGYVKHDPERAGDFTQKEAGCIAEIAGYKALRARKNLIIDGSLQNAQWYKGYFQKLREQFPGIRIMILHVVTPLEDVLRNAAERAQRTGRAVPRDALVASAAQVPGSVRALAAHADFVCRVVNRKGQDPAIQKEEGAPFPAASVPMTWELVRKLWLPIDTNGDGELTSGELQAAVAGGLLTHAVIKTLDKNGDGQIDRCELMHAALVAMQSGTKIYR